MDPFESWCQALESGEFVPAIRDGRPIPDGAVDAVTVGEIVKQRLGVPTWADLHPQYRVIFQRVAERTGYPEYLAGADFSDVPWGELVPLLRQVRIEVEAAHR